MGYRILDNFDPSPSDLREWAYDPDAYLMEQDEDLLLHSVSYIPTLFELAADNHCPKQEYIFFILCQFVREHVLFQGKIGLDQILTVTPNLMASNDYTKQWLEYVERLNNWLSPSGPINDQTAEQIARDLLLGEAGRIGEIISSESVDGWRFILRSSLTETLDISRSTGQFDFTRSVTR